MLSRARSILRSMLSRLRMRVRPGRRIAVGAVVGLVGLVVIVIVGRTLLGRGAPAPAPGPAGANAAPNGIMLVSQPAPRPTELVTFEAGCVTPACHANYDEAPVVHEPIGERACQSCHLDDAGDHTYPLTGESPGLCRECHESDAARLIEHGALGEHGCLACHDAHVSTAPFLLRGATLGATCGRCHAPSDGPARHAPYDENECSVCHEPHGASAAALLREGEEIEQCRPCHTELIENVETAIHSHQDVDRGCLHCHGPHAADWPSLLRAPAGTQCLECHENIGKVVSEATVTHDAVLTGDHCVACHDPHASENAMMLRDDQATVCLGCHGETVTAVDGRTIPDMTHVLTESSTQHGPVAASECSACHSVHGGEHDRLLRNINPRVLVGDFDVRNFALCFGCHSQDLVLLERTTLATHFRDGDRNLHALHVQGRDHARSCTNCHAIHGSEQPRLIADAVAYEGSDWIMPMGFELTTDGGRCAPGCHEPLEYRRGGPPAGNGGDTKGGAP